MRKTRSVLLPTLFVSLGILTASPDASAKVQAGDRSALAIDRVLSPTIQPLTVTSSIAAPGRPIADVYTAFGKNVSPSVEWSGAPPGVRSYVVVMEDPDAHEAHPALHWLVYNIPATSSGLGRNLHPKAQPKAGTGLMQGMNYAGGIGYIGPNPPPDDPAHHYHIEVFALDRLIKAKPGLGLDKLVAAMNDSVLAEGEVIASFAAPPQPPPPPGSG